MALHTKFPTLSSNSVSDAV